MSKTQNIKPKYNNNQHDKTECEINSCTLNWYSLLLLPQCSSSSSSPSIDRSTGNTTFRLPINWGSSIRKYLKKTGTFSRRSYSSGDGSLYFPDLNQESQILDQSSGRFEGKSRVWYKCELEQDIKKLQQQLQEEINLRLALTSAVEHSSSLFIESPYDLPDKAQELLDSLAVLEITVSKLEQESVSLRYLLRQEKNERRLTEILQKKSHYSAPSKFTNSQRIPNNLVTRKRESKQVVHVDNKAL